MRDRWRGGAEGVLRERGEREGWRYCERQRWREIRDGRERDMKGKR